MMKVLTVNDETVIVKLFIYSMHMAFIPAWMFKSTDYLKYSK